MRNKLSLAIGLFMGLLLSSLVVACTDLNEGAPLDIPVDEARPLASVAIELTRPSDEVTPLADLVHFTCGWALSGYGCNNGRGHGEVYATSMTNAITACRAAKPASLPDSCYVIDAQGGGPTDASQCAAAGGSWRPDNSCCNFLGSVSCPNANASYRCGYALSGYGCDNGRGSVVLTAISLSSAISACRRSQPANLPDFCYVRNIDAGNASDPSQCALAGGAWRVTANCCNFRGSTSCP